MATASPVGSSGCRRTSKAVVDGKRTIEIAARQADAVTFAVGAEPERLR
jgi:hypothetical protein